MKHMCVFDTVWIVYTLTTQHTNLHFDTNVEQLIKTVMK